MYRKADRTQLSLEEFRLPFGGRLSADNRWVKLAAVMPWELIEDLYELNFNDECPDGRPPIEARIAFGAMYIKESENLTDERTLIHITENAYMQYFLGLKEFTQEWLFDPSMLTHFRKRFTPEMINEINLELYRRVNPPKPPESGGGNAHENDAKDEREPENGAENGEIDETKHEDNTRIKHEDDTKSKTDDNAQSEQEKKPENSGTLILDATVAPADIRYPTDLSLLNECRENTEQIIDELWEHTSRTGHKTGYRRKKARSKYLKVTKQRKPRKNVVKRAIKEQLQYVKNNIETIDKLYEETGDVLPKKRMERLETIRIVVKQQDEMLETNTRSVQERIVNLRQPHVRPIVRGKARAPVEFGLKLAFAIVLGFTFIDRWDFDNFNEGLTLIESAELYKERFGFFPSAILADTIYRTRENREFCKRNGIRLSGPRLGRPKADEIAADREIAYRDSCERNVVESRNGIAKRRYGLDLIMSRLRSTATCEAAFNVLAMNAALAVRLLLRFFRRMVLARFYGNNWSECEGCF